MPSAFFGGACVQQIRAKVLVTLSPVFFYAVAGSFVNENSVLPVASKSMKAVIDKPRRAAAAFIAALICLFTRIVMLLSDFINSVDINKKFS